MSTENTAYRKSNTLGMSREDAHDHLADLLARKKGVLKILYPTGPIDQVKDLSGKETLNKELADLDRQIAEVLEFYMLGVIESVDSEVNHLTKLTESLISESRKLGKLTWGLLILSVVLAVSALPSFIQFLCTHTVHR
jgi:hypothetical protein